MATSWRRGLKRMLHVHNEYVRLALSEFFGTFTLVFMLDAMVASMTFSRMMPDGSRGPSASLLHAAFGSALAVMTGVLVSGSSGAHLNPALTGGMWAMGRIKWRKVPVYFVAQYAGALLGAAAIYVIYYDTFNVYDGGVRQVMGVNGTASIFATYPSGDHIRWFTAFADQVIATGVLMFVILAITDARNWEIPKPAVPLYVALLIASLTLSLGFNCGAAMNPARDLMPRLFTYLAGWGSETFSYWNYSWFLIPVGGSHLGALIGAGMYQLFVGAHWPEDEDTVHDDGDQVEQVALQHTPYKHQLGNGGQYDYEHSSSSTTVKVRGQQQQHAAGKDDAGTVDYNARAALLLNRTA